MECLFETTYYGTQVVENWTYSLFFLVAELWGAVVISVLFWTLANEVCTVKEAKTIYPLMGIAANVALVAAGNFMKLVSRGLAVSARLSRSHTPHTYVSTVGKRIQECVPSNHLDVVCGCDVVSSTSQQTTCCACVSAPVQPSHESRDKLLCYLLRGAVLSQGC